MSTAPPIVSVLVLAYNHGRFIREALQGIVQQEFDGFFEVLVGDDASTDDTRTIALEFAEKYPGRVEVISRETNVGMHANHADLVARAKGRFLAYCEGDDLWHVRDKLQRQVDLLRAQPEVGAIHADFDRIVQSRSGWKRLSRSNSTMGRDIPTGDVFTRLLEGNFIQTCTLCVRTELVRRYLDSGLPIANYPVGDWPLCIFASRHAEIAYLDDSVAVYRQVMGSVTNSGHAARLQTARGYLGMMDSLCRHFDLDETARLGATRAIQRAILSFAVLAADEGAFNSAWSWLSEHDPMHLSARRWVLRLIIRSAMACRLLTWINSARQQIAAFHQYRSHE